MTDSSEGIPAPLELAPGIHMLPVMHQSVAFANEVRQVLDSHVFDWVAIELPAALGPSLLAALQRLPALSLLAWRSPSVGDPLTLMVDPCDARVEAARLCLESGADFSFIDLLDAGDGDDLPVLPDHATVERIGASEIALRWEKVQPPRHPTLRHRVLAGQLARRAADGNVLLVGSLALLPPLREILRDPRRAATFSVPPEDPGDVRVVPVPDDLLGMMLGELPAVTWLYEDFRQVGGEGEIFPVAEAVSEILRDAAEDYYDELDEEISLTEWRALYQYARNLALVRNRIHPGIEELVTAACGCVDDDYGAIVLEIAMTYNGDLADYQTDPQGYLVDEPDFEAQDEQLLLPLDPAGGAVDLADEGPPRRRSRDLYFDFGDGVQKARHAYPRPPVREIEFRFRRRRPTALEREQWQEQFDQSHDMSICSWPPEDVRIEKFFRHLRQRALSAISEDLSRTEEFQSSLLDGLDFRETTRNFHTGKLFVRRERRPPGRVGPVVLCWHDFPLEVDGLWRTTLHAENQNESDICIYCAPIGRDMVGPMISRTEYHGVLSVYPALHMPDLWSLPGLYQFDTCARLLLAGAILLCEEKYVAWVAPVPPDPDMVQFGRERGVGVIHLPLTSFSRKTLKRVRKVHILGSHAARSWGADYIEE